MPSEVVHRTAAPEQTRELGRRLGALVRSGDVIALSGDLGAGKTVLVQGITAGAGSSGYVASPTFTFVREYGGPVPIYHVDLYRLDDPRQLDDLGLEELFDREGVVVIEWAEKAKSWLPPEHLWMTISVVDDDERRLIRILPKGERYEQMARRLTEKT